jgi:hypothetical protein
VPRFTRARSHCTTRCLTYRSRSWNFWVEWPTRTSGRHPRMSRLSGATIAAMVPLTPRRSVCSRMCLCMAGMAVCPGHLRGMSFPDFRALPGGPWHPSTSNPARFTSTIPIWGGCPVSVRVCTIGVTACRACSASRRVWLTRTMSSASRVRCPRQRDGGAPYRSTTWTALVAHRGLRTPPWGDPLVVGHHGPSSPPRLATTDVAASRPCGR